METVNTNQPVPSVKNIEPTQTPPPNPSSHSKIFIIVLGVVLVLMIGIGSYVLGTRKNQTVVQNQQPTSSPTVSQPSPTATPDKTAGWKKYRNEKYGFEFMYPNPEYYVIEEEDSGIRMKHLTYTDLRVTIHTSKSTNYESLKPCTNYSAVEVQTKPITCLADGAYYGQKELVKETALDGVKAVSYFPNTFSIGGLEWVIQTVNEPFIEITSYTLDKKTFDQILSTFKFIP